MSHINGVFVFTSKLREIGKPMQELQITNLILSSLPESYDRARSNWNTIPRLEITVINLTGKLKAEEKIIACYSKPVQTETAFLAVGMNIPTIIVIHNPEIFFYVCIFFSKDNPMNGTKGKMTMPHKILQGKRATQDIRILITNMKEEDISTKGREVESRNTAMVGETSIHRGFPTKLQIPTLSLPQ
jgi:hypothetical protein